MKNFTILILLFVSVLGYGQIDLPITFDDAGVDYNLTDFGGNASMIVADPADATNMVGQATKTATAELWAGTTNNELGLNNAIGFTDTETKMYVRVWSPDAGTPIRLKVEDVTDPTKSVETEATTTMAGAWETLEFDFANEATGTAELNLGFTFNKVSIFFNFGTTGADAGEKIYYWDDISFEGGTTSTPLDLPITFEDATLDYALVDFGDNVSSIVADPTDATNTVGQAIKLASAQSWAGTTNGGEGLATPIAFTATATKMTVRVWAAAADTPILLKVEDAANGAISSEVLVNTTMAGAWETLEFDFAGGTPALDLANTYNKVSIFFNFGTDGATAGEQTYFWDDIVFGEPVAAALDLPITFEDATLDYALVDFGDNVSSIVADPTDATNTVGQAIKLASAQSWAGTTNGGEGLANAIPFTADDMKMSVRVWAAAAGTPILLKVEDAANGAISSEVLVSTTMAGAWETLEFDFSAGTPALDLANTYDKVSIFFNFGTDGATAGEQTYYWDDIMFVEPPMVAQIDLPITFENVGTVDYALVDFGGNASSIVVDPTDATNTVGQAIKTAGAQTWAGTTNGLNGLANAIPFTASSTKMTVRVWSQDAGTPIRVKVEDATNPGISVETEAATTMAGAWETLEFDFSMPAAGTAALDLANTYNKLSIFFNFGTDGATAGEQTYYWDDVMMVAAPVLDQVDLPITFEDQATVDYNLVDFGGNTSMIVVDPTDATNTVGQAIKGADAQTWAGTTNGGNGLLTAIPFTMEDTKMSVRVWSADAGTPILLKVEDAANGAISSEVLVSTTMAGAWETLEFNFSEGTPTLNMANTYNKVSIFFNFGTDGATAGEQTYYWDDIMFIGGGGSNLDQVDLPITFEDVANIDYALVDFGGNASMIVADPTDATNTVGQAVKAGDAQLWAGTTNGGAGLATAIPFTTTDTKMNLRVWSPDAGTPIRLKVEVFGEPTQSCETEATTTVAGAWETLEFDFSNEATGTAALNTDFAFNVVSIFFNFGTDGATAGEQTYYWDDIMFGEAVSVTNIDAATAGIKISPNPANDFCTIELLKEMTGDINVSLFNIQGKIVKQANMTNSTNHNLDVADLAEGIYFMTIQNNNNRYYQKLVIE